MMRIFILALCANMVGSAAFAEDTKPLVKLVEVQTGASDTIRQFFGHVVAKETVDLAFQVAGQVVEIPVVEGQPISKGALIATLDLEPFEITLDQALVQKEQADRTLKRFQTLQGSAVSQVSVEDAATQVKLAEISVRNAQRSLKNAQLISPFDALVASRNIANFSTIAAGTPIVRLHDMSELRIEIDVSEVLFQQSGQNPNIKLQAKFTSSDELFPLSIKEFNAETSQVGQTFRITLGMTPPDSLVILPGSSVTVFATLRDEAAMMSIPRSALITGNDGTTQVMVFTPQDKTNGTVKPVTIEITPAPDGSVLVVQGLEAGQEIIASGSHLLTDGQAVTRFTGFSN
jgi:RND family efflux transporter MFP subunit